jgi:hypothetical protein
VAVLGAFPFSPLATSELLDGVAKLLVHFVPLFRLAQDVQFEPEERLNAGIYAVAAERKSSLGNARELLQSGTFPSTELERRLWACWEQQSAGVCPSGSRILGMDPAYVRMLHNLVNPAQPHTTTCSTME